MLKIHLQQTAFILDPLEQFEIMTLHCLFSTVYQNAAWVVYSLIFFFLVFNGRRGIRTKPNLVLFRDKTFTLVAGLIKENLNHSVVLFFPVIYLTFLFILFANVIGMLPYSYTVTSSAAATLFFSLTFFIGIALVGYSTHSDALFLLFLPPGVPLMMAPFLILVEATSYFTRVISLATRLFANIMSGHSLLKILGSFVWAILLHGAGPIFFYFFPLAAVFIVTLLEMFVAVLQAYIFVVLVSVYLNDVILIH